MALKFYSTLAKGLRLIKVRKSVELTHMFGKVQGKKQWGTLLPHFYRFLPILNRVKDTHNERCAFLNSEQCHV